MFLYFILLSFSQLYESVLQPLNCRKRGKHSSPSHHNLIHFRLLGVTMQHVTFLYLTVAYTRKQLFFFTLYYDAAAKRTRVSIIWP